MPPKTPDELREQLERQNEEQPAEGKDTTAEGMEVERPSRKEFFSNLEQVARPGDEGNGEKATNPKGSNPGPSI